ncbi:unnamed protein product [Adineta steineri]|uniref:NHL repeat containing protein n=1 Tax=Adineta steineri TaxID=433720 RepID=A0A814IT32_9BILA|nr:unnamed protein product [Adineta steineri]
MNNNNTDIIDVQSINFDTTQPSTSQSRTSCECFRRRKLIWIILASIITVLIILGIIIPTIIVKTKKIQIEEMSTMETTTETTITITEKIATKKETAATTIETTTESITTTDQKTTAEKQLFSSIDNNIDIKWTQHGINIAGGYRPTSKLDGFNSPSSIYIDDDDQTMYIGDSGNSRIIAWEYGAKIGQIVAGGSEAEQTNQLNAINDVGDVRRWKSGEKDGVIVAGGNGMGDKLDQLLWPTAIFVDQDHSVYVADGTTGTGRITKWLKDAKVGIVVALDGEDNGPTLYFEPAAVFVDHLDNIYVADSYYHRIIRWFNGSRTGDIIIGGNGKGNRSNQLSNPSDLSFNRYGNLYVVDKSNHRIQKFDILVN